LNKLLLHTVLLILICTGVPCALEAQYLVKGTVYDSSRQYALEAVTVLSSSGKGALTDMNGNYQIEVGEKDSIWFSYLGKPTIRYAVLKMTDPLHFDISLRVNVTVLKNVTVKPRDYRMDSLQNRLDYAKGFDFEKPKLRPTLGGGPGGVGVGFDLDQIIGMFQFRKNRNMERFQSRLIEQEHDKYVDHRFNKQIVRRLTGLGGDRLDTFMVMYRPSYQFAVITSDYEFQAYIKDCFAKFQAGEGRRRGF
jgi:hypothetical protein